MKRPNFSDALVALPVMIGATPGALLPAPITALAFPVCMFVGGPRGQQPLEGANRVGLLGFLGSTPQNTVGNCSWIT